MRLTLQTALAFFCSLHSHSPVHEHVTKNTGTNRNSWKHVHEQIALVILLCVPTSPSRSSIPTMMNFFNLLFCDTTFAEIFKIFFSIEAIAERFYANHQIQFHLFLKLLLKWKFPLVKVFPLGSHRKSVHRLKLCLSPRFFEY